MKLIFISLLYAIILISIQLSFLVLKFILIFEDRKVFSSLDIMEAMNSYFSVELLRFFSTIIFLHFILSLFILIFQDVFVKTLPIRKSIQSLLLFSLFSFVILVANTLLFPHSAYVLKDSSINDNFFILGILLSIGFLSIIDIKKIINRVKTVQFKFASIIFLFFSIALIYTPLLSSKNSPPPSENNISNNDVPTEQGNIIIFSVDSLKPEVTKPLQPKTSFTPFISQQLSQSYNFTQAYTPLARTFPSWMSVLTGQLPKNHKAQFNLTNPKRFKGVKTLAHTLQNYGYHTVYASDEKRFANITTELGFDQILGPPDGLADFIIGTFSDSPLLNLVTLLPSAENILPYSTLNRAASVTYDPRRFSDYLINEFKDSITAANGKPLFIAIHFCLPHHPFTWRSSPLPISPEEAYANTIKMADKQVESVYKALSQLKIINESSTQIIMSDHGETLPSDQKIFSYPDGNKELLSRLGHGTSVKQISQHHVVFAVQNSNLGKQKDSQLASLIDIAPTLLQLLSLPILPSYHFDGINLLTSTTPQQRWLSFETGYNVNAMHQTQLNQTEIFQQAVHVYRITQQGKVVIKQASYPSLLQQKQYAQWNGQTLVMQAPNAHDPSRKIEYNWKYHSAKILSDPQPENSKY